MSLLYLTITEKEKRLTQIVTLNGLSHISILFIFMCLSTFYHLFIDVWIVCMYV